MKFAKIFSTICILFALVNFSLAQTTTSTTTTYNGKTYVLDKETYPQWSVAPTGGVIFPIARLSESFKPNGSFGLEVGAKVNKEVGFYGRFGYYFMASSISGAPVGKYLEATIGPRYYFSSANVKSKLFAEAGIGAYTFSQASYVDPADPSQTVIPELNETRAGINAGIGASIFLTQNVSLMLKTRYNTIFTSNATTSFITGSSGIEFRF